MSFENQFLQFFSLSQFLIPFIVLFFEKKGKLISLLHSLGIIGIFLFLLLGKPGTEISTVFGGWQINQGVQIKLDTSSVYFILSASIVFFSTIVYSSQKKYDRKFFFLIDLVYGTLINLFLSNDLFNMYVCLELTSLISYLLISSKLKNRQVWASLKYMILSAVGFNFYLIGVAMIYRSHGTLNLDLIAISGNVNDMALIFIIVALLVKSGTFLFSMWLPSAHSEAEIPISAILSAVIVKAGIFCLIRTIPIHETSFMSGFIVYIGLFTMISGMILAMLQKDIKLILAFSTMSQVGYILMGIYSNGAQYAFCHAIFKSSIFLIIGIIYAHFGTRNIEKIKKSKKKISILVLILFSVAYFSISGMPFFLGYSEKKLILSELPEFIKNMSIVTSVGTAFYLGRIFSVLIRKCDFKIISIKYFVKNELIAVLFLAIVTLFFGIKNTYGMSIKTPDILKSVLPVISGLTLSFIIPFNNSEHFPDKLFNISNILKIYVLIIGFFIAVLKFAY